MSLRDGEATRLFHSDALGQVSGFIERELSWAFSESLVSISPELSKIFLTMGGTQIFLHPNLPG